MILFRTNSNVEIWDQNKKRLFEQPKIEYTLRSLRSLFKSINFCKKRYQSIKIDLTIVSLKQHLAIHLERFDDLH